MFNLNIYVHTQKLHLQTTEKLITEKIYNKFLFFFIRKYFRNSHLKHPTSDTILSRMTKSWLFINSRNTENLTKFNKLYTKFNNVHQYILNTTLVYFQ